MPTAKSIVSEGLVVFSHQWDSGGPGAGGDALNVYRSGDYYAAVSDEGEHLGPYNTLLDAISACEAVSITDASKSIDSEELSLGVILDLLKFYCEEDYPTLLINGSTCKFDSESSRYTPTQP